MCSFYVAVSSSMLERGREKERGTLGGGKFLGPLYWANVLFLKFLSFFFFFFENWLY